MHGIIIQQSKESMNGTELQSKVMNRRVIESLSDLQVSVTFIKYATGRLQCVLQKMQVNLATHSH
jgi:hypothetical protein